MVLILQNNMKAFIFLLSLASLSLAIPRDEFYSFGPDAGDTAVSPNDDGSSPQISLQFGAFPYFDVQHTTLYVSNYIRITVQECHSRPYRTVYTLISKCI